MMRRILFAFVLPFVMMAVTALVIGTYAPWWLMVLTGMPYGYISRVTWEEFR